MQLKITYHVEERFQEKYIASTLEEITCHCTVFLTVLSEIDLQIRESEALMGRWGTGSTPLLIKSISTEFLLQENRIYICSYADRH